MKRLLVALVLLALMGSVFLVLQRRENREEREQRSESRYLSFDADRVTALTLRTMGENWTYERNPDGWRLVEPVRDRADDHGIGMLFSLLALSEVADVLEGGGGLAQFGLDPPRAELVLMDGDSTVATVRFGNPLPTAAGIYSAVEGRSGVLVVNVPPNSLFTDPDPNRLRERSLLGMVGTEAERIEIGNKGASFELAREATGWWIVRPQRLPASDASVTRFLELLEEAEVAGFVDGMEAANSPFGAGAPRISLQGQNRSRSLELGPVREDGMRLVRRGDREAILAVRAEEVEDLPLVSERFLSRKITKINRYTVDSFEYRRDGRRVRAERGDEEAWTAEDGAAVPAEKVYSFLAQVLETRWSEWKTAGGDSGGELAVLEFRTEDGLEDRIRFHADGTVGIESLPAVSFRVRTAPPPIPEFP